MGERDLEAIRKTDKGHFKMRMLHGQVPESFVASRNDRRLQTHDRVVLKPGKLRQVARQASRCRGQARVGVDEQVQVVRFSGHGW